MTRTSSQKLARIAVCCCALGVLSGRQAALADPQAGSGPYRLAYKYEPGKFIHYKTVSQQTYTTRLGEREINKTNGHSEEWKHYRVVAVDEQGNGILETQRDRAVMRATDSSSGEEYAFDSRDGLDNCPRAFRRVMQGVGKPYARMTFTPSGQLVAMKALGDAQSSGQQESDQDARSFLIPLPEKPVQVGDSWSDDFEVFVSVQELKVPRPVKIHRKYTLTKVEGPIATIEIRMAVLAAIHDPHILGQLISRTPRGTVQFDMERGAITSKVLSADKTELGALGPRSALRVEFRLDETLTTPPQLAGK